ncbi:MAG: hypothetical protein IJS19_09575 [Muribaculaceae bacterium]|nr:hypothetical protein [Muribaculaceae bacterium]
MIKKLVYAITIALCGSFADSLSATTYLVSPAATTTGATIYHNGSDFVVGTNAFADIATLMAANPDPNSVVFVAAGSFSANATISVEGLDFRGNNAFIDPRAQTRYTASSITGTITVNANNVTLNGFDFSNAGKVINTAATGSAPITGFSFIFNSVANSSIARTSDGGGTSGFLRLGKAYTGADALNDVSQKRYKTVTVAHNSFTGDVGPDFVILAGLFGTTNIFDNTFTGGAHALHIANSRGTINILNNNFTNCGNGSLNESTKGDFAIRLYRNSLAGTTVYNIKHNDFNNCSGQQGLYPCIRLFQGNSDNGNYVTPKNASINLNYNVFRNKTKIHADYNYLLYVDKEGGADINCDTRFNQTDNSGYQFAFVNSPSFDSRERYYLDNTGRIKPKDCTISLLKDATTLGAATVMQSFDFDTPTGDLYTIQIMGNALAQQYYETYGDPKGLVVSHIKAGKTTAASTMNLVYGGHGSNMAIARIDGKVYIFCGGKGTLAEGATETTIQALVFFPYVAGASVDLRQDSFTYNGKTYPIQYLDRSGSRSTPSIDEGNRLLCYRTRHGSANPVYDSYRIFDLDDVIQNANNATMLKEIKIEQGSNPSSFSGDTGFMCYGHQGHAINGDFVYVAEGMGTEHEDAINGKSTVWVHVCNWRKNSFSYRYRFTQSEILSLVPGEPEGVKVRRDENGHACLILGLTKGSSGARQAVFYKFTPPDDGVTLPLKQASASPDKASLTMTTPTLDPATASLKLFNSYLNGEYTFTISGEGAQQFEVTSVANNASYAAETTVNIAYTPIENISQHQAYLRCSSPYMDDIVIPLTGRYAGDTHAEPSIADKKVVDVVYYNLQGIRIIRPAKGEVCVKVSTLSDGSIQASKFIGSFY